MTQRIVPVILCGGAGSRLWPLSRDTFPKPFVTLPDGTTLIGHAFARIAALGAVLPTLVVTQKDHAHLVTRAASEAGVAAPGAIIEPMARNTAAAVASAALRAKQLHGDDVALLVLTADHLIAPLSRFAEIAHAATTLAGTSRLVTFGIQPTAPETGYGYLESGEAIEVAGATGRSVRRFVEKPALAVAQQYLASGHYYWNSGMFLLPVGALLAEFDRHAPEVLAAASNALQGARLFNDAAHLESSAYMAAPSISFDYAVMEKSDCVAMVAADFSWTDIGAWQAFADMVPKDAYGNVTVGDVSQVDSARTFVLAGKRMIATLGVSDLTIVDTDDALLVARTDRAQDVKKIYESLRKAGSELATHPLVVRRPWGTYQIIDEGVGFKSKRITVNPGASISLQRHEHRAEHWTIVAGTSEVQIDDTMTRCVNGDHIHVPLGAKHRIRNIGTDDVIFIEVQTGATLLESDIQRFEDQYGRA